MTREDLLVLEDVVGVADSEIDGKPCIKVYLRRENSETLAKLPASIEGVRLVAEISGTLKAD